MSPFFFWLVFWRRTSSMLCRSAVVMNKWRIQRPGQTSAPLRQGFRKLSDLRSRVEEMKVDTSRAGGPAPLNAHLQSNREVVRGANGKHFFQEIPFEPRLAPTYDSQTIAVGHDNGNKVQYRDPNRLPWFSNSRSFDHRQCEQDDAKLKKMFEEQHRKPPPKK